MAGNPIVDVVTGAVTGIGNAVSGVGRVFFGDRAARDAQTHDENAAVLGQFAGEFAHRGKRTWFDSLIDGLNRLPRPAMALGCLGLLVWAPADPVGFSAAMMAFDLVPLWLAGTVTTIVGFYFTFRHLEKRLEFHGPDPRRVQAVLSTQRELRAMRAESAGPLRPGEAATPWKPPEGEVVLREDLPKP